MHQLYFPKMHAVIGTAIKRV